MIGKNGEFSRPGLCTGKGNWNSSPVYCELIRTLLSVRCNPRAFVKGIRMAFVFRRLSFQFARSHSSSQIAN